MSSEDGWLTLVVAVAGAIGAVAAAWVAWKAMQLTRDIATAQLFLDLRKKYEETHLQLDVRYRDEKWDPRSEPAALRTLERYWLHTFSEWYATTRLSNGRFKEMWSDFYAPAILGALHCRPLCITLREMISGSRVSSFSGHREAFRKALAPLYEQAVGEPL